MKKRLLIFAFLCSLLLCLSACGQGSEASAPTTAAQTQPTTEGALAAPQNDSGIDIDLTQMTSTMVYSQVYDFLANPMNYIGKTVKMEGSYFPEQAEGGEQVYHFLIINDATGCCPQGLEFICSDPDAVFPEENDMLTLVGTFELYDENGWTYFRFQTDEVPAAA